MPSIGIAATYVQSYQTTQGGSWYNNGDGCYHNDKIVFQFDLRGLANQVLAKHPNAYLDYVWGKRRIKEGKNGGSVPCYIPNVPSSGGWIGNPNQRPYSQFWNAGARGSTVYTNVDGHSWRDAWFECGAQNAAIPFTDLATTPFWVMTDHRNTTGKHRIYWASMYLYAVQIYEFKPGFPNWAGDVMAQNGKARPGWVSQLVAGNWLTTFRGGKEYLTAI